MRPVPLAVTDKTTDSPALSTVLLGLDVIAGIGGGGGGVYCPINIGLLLTVPEELETTKR